MKKLKVKNIIKVFIVLILGIFNPNVNITFKNISHKEFNIGFILSIIFITILIYFLTIALISIFK